MPGFSINNGSGETNTVETVRDHRWRIEKLGPLGLDPLGFGSGTWYAKSFGFPEVSSEIVKTEGAAIEYHHAGRIKYNSASLTFYDAISNDGTSFGKLLNEWYSTVHGESSTGETSYTSVGYANSYKDTSIFQMETTGTQDQRDAFGSGIFEITLHNSWPSKVSHTDLDYSSSGIGEFTVELTFDWYTSKNLFSGGDISQGPLLAPGFDVPGL